MTQNATATWCVRFLNGPLRGRTIALKHGTNVVGSGLDCDILLQGDVLPRHLVFTVGDIAVSVQKQGTAQAKLNGDDLPMQRRSAVRGDIVSVGSIDFEIDKVQSEGSPLEGLPAARMEPPERIERAPYVERPVRVERSESDTLDEPAAAPAVDAPTPMPPAHEPASWRFNVPVRYGLAIGGVIALTTLSIVIGMNTYESKPAWSVVSPTADLESLHRIVADYPEVKVVDFPDGRIGVRGFVESSARRMALSEALKRFGNELTIQVHAADQIVEQAQRYINEPDISVDYAGAGRLVVSGTSNNGAIHDKVARLSADLRSVVAVVDEVESNKRPRPTGVTTRSSSELAQWKGSLPAEMVGLTEYSNGMRYIQLSNGQRYYEGATLKSGDELVNIEADHLVVTKTGKKPRTNARTPVEASK